MEKRNRVEDLISDFLQKYRITIIDETENYVKIYMENENPYVLDNLKSLLQKEVLIEKNVSLKDLNFNTSYLAKIKGTDGKDLEDLASEAPIVKLLNNIIDRAIEKKATDIHFEPYESHTDVKFRIDGVLRSITNIPNYLYPAIISRIKILAKLNIAEKRLPQDGKFIYKINDKEYDIRVSTIPTIYGESVVLRILNKQDTNYSLDTLGFSKEHLKLIREFMNHSYGMILVTGPTGSGKTTTLYSILKELNTGKRKIITVEDPVEYTIPGIVQVQVNPKVGLTFSRALRTILRQDPDIIMIGEIRDKETAEIAIRAALTGHLVLATLHTNDAVSAFTRLIDMGIEEFLVSSAVVGVISQRLVRKICNYCIEKYRPKEVEIKLFRRYNLDTPDILYKGVGCDKCEGEGYKGRTVIAEIVKVDDTIRQAIMNRASASEIRKICRNKGMKELIEDGLEKVKMGITTLSEVIRVTNN